MKKKITAIALAVCILVIGVVGATMSYFTDKKTATNTFTFGNGVKISLTETSTETKDESGKTLVYEGTEKEGGVGYSFDKVLPGLVYSKAPKVTVASDSLSSYVVVTATVPTAYAWDGLFNNTVDTTNFTTDTKPENSRTVYYFYAKSAAAAGSSLVPFTQVKINPALTQGTGETSIAGEPFDVVVNAYAIQTEGFTDAKAAYEAAFASSGN